MAAPTGADAARAWTTIWLAYLPEIAAMARQLDASASTDPDAHAALQDRMENQRGHLTRIFESANRDGQLQAMYTPTRAAETLWSLVHATAWQQLVIECGWTPTQFEDSRLALLNQAILQEPTQPI